MAKKNLRAVSRAVESTGGNNKTADQPGYFLSLTVRNVRCFGDQEQTLDLSDGKDHPAQWTILLGDNGTGKTTLLQALAYFYPFLDPQPFRTTAAPSHVLFWEITALRGAGESTGSIIARFFSGANLGIAGVRARLGRMSLVIRTDGASGTVPAVCPPVCFAYGAGRRLGAGAISEKWRVNAMASLYADDVPLRNAEEWLSQLDWAAGQESPVQKQQQKRLEEVKELLVRILPDVTSVRRSAPQTETDRPRFEFKTPYGWVELRQLGYGYQTMIAWMVDFASRMVERYPDSADPLAEPAVVLVDEIDLHLHPKWQRELMGYLSERFPNTQFIATAHSPLIVQAAASVNANIAVLRRDGDHVVIDNKPESIRGWRVDQILTSDIYDLPTARPKEFDEAIQRRVTLLSKPQLTPKDRRELRKLEKQLEGLPAGETASDARKMMDLARDTLDLLKKHQSRRR